MQGRWQWVPTLGGLILAFILVILSAMALNIALTHIRDNYDLVQHTDSVLLQCSIIDGDVVEVESVERAFLLTNDDDYRQEFERLNQALPRQLEELSKATADNLRQQESLARMRPALRARLSELNQVVRLTPTDPETALALVRAAKGRRLTSVIREHIAEFRRAEIDLLDRRELQAGRQLTGSIVLAVTTIVLALLTGALTLYSFQRARRLHREAELRTELIHISRLNMMGQMASMLAHELNQPLTATSNYLRAMLRQISDAREHTPPSSALTHGLSRSVAQMERARDIVQRLRNFIRKGEPAKAIEAIEPMLDEAVALLGMTHEGVTISRDIEPDLPAVLVDRIQVEQVLINLMRNGIEAMRGRPRRLLELSASSWETNLVRIAVRDTGEGIAKEVADKLFRPFVTTKHNGMGVGLSICHTIITSNGGLIWAEANPEGGTVFYFTLPIAPGITSRQARDSRIRPNVPLGTVAT
jgi:two-component system, LuxR family, sensor kinase FixL